MPLNFEVSDMCGEGYVAGNHRQTPGPDSDFYNQKREFCQQTERLEEDLEPQMRWQPQPAP